MLKAADRSSMVSRVCLPLLASENDISYRQIGDVGEDCEYSLFR